MGEALRRAESYLDDLDRYGVPADRRVLAALGDGVLKLSARRGAGAHPYLTTPEHTVRAREMMGPAAFLAPEQKIVLTGADHVAIQVIGTTELLPTLTTLAPTLRLSSQC